MLPGWPYRTTTNDALDRQVYSSPAVGDLDGDGRFETVVIDRDGYVHAIRADGSAMPGFEGGVPLRPPGQTRGIDDVFASPILADVDGDGRNDILASFLGRLVALDVSGDELWSIDAPQNDFRFNAPAVGQLDGRGGLELVASSNRFGVPNPPRGLGVYRLPESPIAPAWPMHRRSADGMAVAQNPTFVVPYIRATFRALLDREASASDIAFFSDLILSNTWTPETLADTVALTPEARSVVVRSLFARYVDRSPSPEEVIYGQDLLATRPARDLAVQLLLSRESVARSDGTLEGFVDRMYEKVVRRPPVPEESAIIIPLLERGDLSIEGLADFLLNSEQFILLDIAVPVVLAYRTEFPDAPFDEAAVATVLLDRAGGRLEEGLRAGIIASGGRYERTSTIGGFVRSAYADLLQRQATPAEVAGRLRGFAAGTLTPQRFLNDLIDGPEGRALFVTEQVRALLGRAADASTIAALANYGSREELRITLAASPEYVARNGGTLDGFVRAAFRDLAGVDPVPRSTLNEWVNLIGSGRQTRVDLARALTLGALGANKVTVEQLFRYLPDESKGVLRTALEAPPNGPAVNPDPALIDALVNARAAGASERDILTFLLTTPAYLARSAYVRGLYVSAGNRR